MSKAFDRSAMRWVLVKNADTQPAPPYALLAPTGVDSSGNITIARPTTDSQQGLLVNGPTTIPAGMQGQAHQTFPAIIAYDDGGGSATPANGDTWGSAANSWKLTTGKTGFLIVGGAANGLVNALPPPGSAAPLSLSGVTYTNTSFPNSILTTLAWSSSNISSFGKQTLGVSGTDLEILTTGIYRWWLTVRWQYNPVAAATYGQWMTRQTPSGASPFFASSYDAGGLIYLPSVFTIPNPACTIGPIVQQLSAGQKLYFQLWQNSGSTVIAAATAWCENITGGVSGGSSSGGFSGVIGG